MRLRDIVGLGIALLLAISVAFLTRIFLTKKEEPKPTIVAEQPLTTKVLIATKTLPVGSSLKTGDLAWQNWPQVSLNPNYVTETSLASSSMKMEDFTGAVVRSQVNAGEPVVIKDFIKRGEKGFLAAILSPGKRAISIDVSPATASSGLILPGDFVDVILSRTISSGSEGTPQQVTTSHTVLNNVKVMAIDTNLSISPDKVPIPHVVTLEVSPSEAESLMTATKEGTISLSLRSLFKAEAPSFSPESLTGRTKVTIIRGRLSSTVEFDENIHDDTPKGME